MTNQIEIGRGKRGRRAFSLDDVSVVPARRTRDPQDVSLTWRIDAYTFDMPVIGAPMDLSLIHISEPTRLYPKSRMPSSA